jgi:hypothetical protein
MRYKSSPVMMFVDFLKLIVAVFSTAITFLLFLVWILLKTAVVSRQSLDLTMFVVISVISIFIAAILAFYRHNVSVVVNEADIRFYRGSRELRVFSFYEHSFSSNIVQYRMRGIPMGVTRYLVVIPKNGDRVTRQNCFNFNQNTFERFFAQIRSYDLYYQEISNAAVQSANA